MDTSLLDMVDGSRSVTVTAWHKRTQYTVAVWEGKLPVTGEVFQVKIPLAGQVTPPTSLIGYKWDVDAHRPL